jgi:hypothetical protein
LVHSEFDYISQVHVTARTRRHPLRSRLSWDTPALLFQQLLTFHLGINILLACDAPRTKRTISGADETWWKTKPTFWFWGTVILVGWLVALILTHTRASLISADRRQQPQAHSISCSFC